jgi:signal transduction histidine kinase
VPSILPLELGSNIEDLLDHISSPVIVRDPDGAISFWNSAAEQLYGWDRTDVIGDDADALLNSRPAFGVDDLGPDGRVTLEIGRLSANRRSVLVQSDFVGQRGEDGALRYVVETSRDITEERGSHRASREEEKRYRNLFHAMTAAFFDIDVSASLDLLAEMSAAADGDVRTFILNDPSQVRRLLEAARIIEMNDRVAQILGFSRADGLETLAPLWPSESDAVFLDTLLARAQGIPRLTREVRLRTRAGADLYGVLTACLAPESVGEDRVLIGIVDTTELMHANAEAERSREHHRALFQHMPMAFLRVNGDALGAYYEELGLSPAIDVAAFLSANPAVLARVGKLCFVEEANPQAAILLGADRAEDLTGVPIAFAWQARPDTLARILAAGIERRAFEEETQLNTLDGRLVDVLFATATIQENGRRLSVIGMIDIGDRLKAQDAFGRLQAEFAHASRISLLGELSASIAHEISQPLAAIATTGATGLRWLNRPEPDVDQARTSLDRIVNYAQRTSEIIARVRQMASGRPPVLSVDHLSHVVTGALQLIEAQARSNRVELRFKAATGDDCVDIDRTQIEQVVVNLVVNAVQAIAGSDASSRVVEISISTLDDLVECTVCDSGPGIPDARIEQVFERFVSSKPEGTGLGLALCRSIIHAHSGEITVEGRSELGGALFRFSLPRTSGAH